MPKQSRNVLRLYVNPTPSTTGLRYISPVAVTSILCTSARPTIAGTCCPSTDQELYRNPAPSASAYQLPPAALHVRSQVLQRSGHQNECRSRSTTWELIQARISACFPVFIPSHQDWFYHNFLVHITSNIIQKCKKKKHKQTTTWVRPSSRDKRQATSS